MKIVWKPKMRRESCEHLGVLWLYDEVKDVPEDRKIRINLDGDVHLIPLIDCLLDNADFQDAETGINPRFQCRCGNELADWGTFNRFTGEPVPFEHEGVAVCRDCFVNLPTVVAPVLDAPEPEPAEDPKSASAPATKPRKK
jgi:hypothetical protein